MPRVSIKIEKELNKQLSIFALLEGKKKQEFINKLLSDSLDQYKLRYNKFKFT